MADWNAAQYLKFQKERTRPAEDLLSQVLRVQHAPPNHIVDLGCGPGNSTNALAARYPNAHTIAGIDSSPDMIQKAQSANSKTKTAPQQVTFAVEDLRTYRPDDKQVDLFFSNAVFQWVPFKERISVIKKLLETQPSKGVFAFQVPDNYYEPTHAAMRDTARDGPWAGKLESLSVGPALEVFQSPGELYNELKPLCETVDIWHTQYYNVLDSHESIVEWVKGTGLKPFLEPLSSDEEKGFLKAYLERLKKAYPALYDGKVMLRYPRLFAVVSKA